ncbi:DUF5658 family protein [Haloarcula nitratireducens]|uniref:DUF5658 family protein n=1 Tax=Haloarcula nitratireducens TaxID=2487749 RepID=A0AAW4PIQ3_9EURY|nr:DUF5658 family protein [Halomicroarcula nitratireducens]MBX0297864.1 DUF5658 family protein [Halomicroarcula nitratireducens]
MDWKAAIQGNCRCDSSAASVWALAIVLFGLGDILTTGIGLRIGGVVETNPIPRLFFHHSVLGAMGALKLAAFGGFYVLWKLVPRPHSLGVPLGLAILGGIVTSWNLRVILLALST